MSADAAPVVDKWMKEKGYGYNGIGNYMQDDYRWNFDPKEYAQSYMARIDEESRDMGIRNFNMSRYKAKLLIGE